MWLKRYLQKIHKNMYLIFVLFVFIAAAFFQGLAEARDGSGIDDIYLKERQVIEVNKSLKSVIEENKALEDRSDKLEKELGRIKRDQADLQGRYKELRRDRDALIDSVKKGRIANSKYSKEIKRLEKEIADIEVVKDEFRKKTKRLEEELAAQETINNGGQYYGLKPKAVAKEDKGRKKDPAKTHYNMGNTYFQKGQYEIAAREYYQAVVLMPDDPDAHYNLAFVSGEYLNDHETALRHYRIFLYLNPESKDAPFVKKKIIHAELLIKSAGDSPSEKKNR